MPDWLPDELAEAAPVIRSIEDFAGIPRRTPPPQTLELSLSSALPLLEGLSSTIRALPTRQLSRAFGFDEHRTFQWRLEHKLTQAMVLDHFCPGSVPVTRGLGRLLQTAGKDGLRAAIVEAFPQGYYIKTALGDSSGENPLVDRTHLVVLAIERGELTLPECPTSIDERWIVQERVPIVTEYRVHTMEDRVIEDLTYLRYGRGDIGEARVAPNGYVQSLLDRLPCGIVNGSLLGWDIVSTKDGRFMTIEVNFAGYHPVHRVGYQCSGYYQDLEWGACCTARLLRFVEQNYGVECTVTPDWPESNALHVFYTKLMKWGLQYRGIGQASSLNGS